MEPKFAHQGSLFPVDPYSFRFFFETEFERIIALKERLDNKTNNIIAMGGTISTIFMGFGVFLITYVTQTSLCFLIPAILTFFAEIGLTTISIGYAMSAYKLKEYSYPMDYNQFSGNNGKKIKENFTKADDIKFNSFLIDEYLDCNKDNEDNNTVKSQKIGTAKNHLLIALIIVPIFAIFVILAKYVTCPSL